MGDPRLLTAPLTWVLEFALRSPHLARAPIYLYRHGFGFLLGSRMLMLQHIGRRTGAARFVVLEVVDHPEPDVYVVASGFGERSQWYRNVEADPHVEVTTAGRRSAPATGRRLSSTEVDAVLTRYEARHPRAWASLMRIVEATLDDRVEPPGSALPMIEVRIA